MDIPSISELVAHKASLSTLLIVFILAFLKLDKNHFVFNVINYFVKDNYENDLNDPFISESFKSIIKHQYRQLG